MSKQTSRRSEASRRSLGRDRGWKAKAVCVDGPAARTAIGRHVDEGERVEIRVSVESASRMAVYESVGECPEVPTDDGVGLKFVGYKNEPEEDRLGRKA